MIRSICNGRRLFAIGVVMLSLTFGNATAQQDVSLKTIQGKFQEFRALASSLQGKVISSNVFQPQGKAPLVSTDTWIFKQSKGCVLMHENTQHSNGNVTEMVWCINTKYGFNLTKKDGAWTVRSLDVRNPQSIRYGNQSLAETVLNWLTVSFPRELIDKETTKIENIASKEMNATVIKYENTFKPGPPVDDLVKSKGTMWLDRNIEFALVKVEAQSTSKRHKQESKSTVILEYDGKLEGFPKLKKRTVSALVTQDGKLNHSKTVSHYELWLDRKAPPDQFRLSAFGLPEPQGIVWEDGKR